MDKIQARMLIEILGRPKDYIEDAAVKLITKLDTEKGVKVIEKTFHEAVPVEKSKDLFTTFTEVIVELDSIEMYFAVIFAYMPANVEILSPEKISVKAEDLNQAGNKVIQRMHDYDAIVKNTLAKQDILTNQLKEVAPHLFQPSPIPSNQEAKDGKPIEENKKQNPKKNKRSKE